MEILFEVLTDLQKFPLNQPAAFLKWYELFQIWLKVFDSYLDILAASLMGCGFVVFTVSNVGAIKCYGLVPTIVYLVLPFTSVFVFLVVYFTLPFAAHVAEVGKASISQRKLHFLLQMQEKLVVWKRKF